MNIKKNISLKNYNTFGIDVLAKRFVSVTSLKELETVISKEKNIFLISGGSNMLLTRDIEKLVVHINLKGIEIEKEDKNYIYLIVNAGEDWHKFVTWCVNKNYGGLENLSLIPGKVGTCPIQNIGAYGVEVKDLITSVQAIEIETGDKIIFSNQECNFGYRNSIFKNEKKNKYILTSVGFKLTKNNHKLNTSYGAIEAELESNNILTPSIKDISEAVINIRKSKLPDPKKIGNSGSFFKNPIISKEHFLKLKEKYRDIPSYEISNKEIKVPAGWLIEKLGFKGKTFGNYGIHKKQALVLVNYNNASGKDIYDLAKTIQKSIKTEFDINLEIEVNIIE